MGAKPRYTAEDKQKIYDLADKGMTDTDITAETGFGYSYIQSVTTKYWEDKMKNKNLKNENLDAWTEIKKTLQE